MLHGFPPGQRYHIAEALERELARLLAEQGLPPSLAVGGEAALLDGGSFEVAPGARADAIGAQIAQAMHRSSNLREVLYSGLQND